jgi:hypothetical protein
VEAAIQCPEADAVMSDFGSLTYADLLIRAQNIAVVLKRHGIGSGHLVGIARTQSPAFITAIAGVILAGAAYVPLEHLLLQAAELRRVRANGISLILFDGSSAPSERFLEAWKSLGMTLDVSRIEQETMPSSTEMKISAIEPSATAALLLDTNSGAARVTHRRIARLCSGNGPLHYGPGETFLLPTSASGLFELWCSLLHGASLALAPEQELAPMAFAEWTRRLGVSVLCLPVARVHEYIDQAPEVFARLRHLVIESDGRSGVISPQRVEWLQRHHSMLKIVHTYTTKKIAGYATAYGVPAHYRAQSALPIGRALAGLHDSILDRTGQPVRAGEIGELAFSGEDLCDEAICLTGERARRRMDGLLELHGHTEPQLLPVSNARVASAGFVAEKKASEVLVAEDFDHQSREQLDHFFAPDPNQHQENQTDERPAEAQKIETSITPALTTTTTTYDRLAVQQRKKDNEQAASPERSHEKILEQIRSLWLRLLRRNSIGYEEDFFEAGGTQVQMIRMHAELNRKFPGSITMGQLSVLTTIRKIYEHLVTNAAERDSNGLIQRGA